jgi:hypothetical protein
MRDGNGGKKGEPPNQRRRINRIRRDDARQEENLSKLEKDFWEKKQPKKKVKAKKLTPRQIAAAKRKFDKYPSAVANAWAKKQPR